MEFLSKKKNIIHHVSLPAYASEAVASYLPPKPPKVLLFFLQEKSTTTLNQRTSLKFYYENEQQSRSKSSTASTLHRQIRLYSSSSQLIESQGIDQNK